MESSVLDIKSLRSLFDIFGNHQPTHKIFPATNLDEMTKRVSIDREESSG